MTDSISTPTDVDVYRFTASAKQTIAFHVTTTAGSNLQGYLEVLDSAGDYISSNSSSPAPNESYPTTGGYLEYTFANAGTYYVAISSRQNTAFNVLTGGSDRDGTMGGYTLTLADVGSQDPNDQLTEATSIAVGSTLNDTINTPTDVDVYHFTVSAGQTVNFSIARTSGNLNPYVEIVDANGDYITSGTSALQFQFTVGGTYYVAVASQENTAFNLLTGGSDRDGTMGGYTLRLS